MLQAYRFDSQLSLKKMASKNLYYRTANQLYVEADLLQKFALLEAKNAPMEMLESLTSIATECAKVQKSLDEMNPTTVNFDYMVKRINTTISGLEKSIPESLHQSTSSVEANDLKTKLDQLRQDFEARRSLLDDNQKKLGYLYEYIEYLREEIEYVGHKFQTLGHVRTEENARRWNLVLRWVQILETELFVIKTVM